MLSTSFDVNQTTAATISKQHFVSLWHTFYCLCFFYEATSTNSNLFRSRKNINMCSQSWAELMHFSVECNVLY